MIRRNFLTTALAFLPAMSFSRIAQQFRDRAGRAFRVGAGEARNGHAYTMKGVTMNRLDTKIAAADTEGGLAVFEQRGSTPNGGPPLHIHPHQDEWFFVLEGEYLFQAGDEQFQMKAGDTIFLPRNVPHAFIQRTEKARTIVSYFPAGQMEEFFAATSAWTSPPTQEEIAAVFAAHGMQVVGPPLN